ncbi:AAA family ATPase [Planktothrix agardhii]|uniref:AAA family ATPase n=1 Tax=Planktothrix agardhii TaxID=1160 RepID=UPI0003F4E994|nr:AAA family ATPase [Planktothrix agardhii]
MNTVSYSTLEELKTAISSYNPFSRVAVDNVSSIRKEEPYLKLLNTSIFEKVIDVIRQVKHSSDGKDKVATLVITGDPGAGKTQLVKRIRRHCLDQYLAILIYANLAKCSSSDLLKSQFLEMFVKELALTERDENKNFKPNQWQEIATAMINSAAPSGKSYATVNLVNNFDQFYAKAKTKNQNIIQQLSQGIKKVYPHFDAYTVRAILWTLSQTYGDFAVEWLAGNALDSETAQGMGLPSYTNQNITEKNSAAFSNLLKILSLVSQYKTLVICFDEFDDKVLESGDTNAQLITEFIKDLYDNLEQSNSSKGLSIISLMFKSIWTQQIKGYYGNSSVTDSMIARMSTSTKGEPLSLEPINGKSILELVSFWLEEFLYKPRQLKPHDSVYPFTVEKLEEIGKNRPTIRETLDWCYKEYKKIQETIVKDPKEQYQLARQQTNKLDITDYLEDNDFLANTLKFGFEQLINQPLEGVTASGEKLKKVIIESVESIDNKWVKFKLNGIENESKRFIIGVAVIQNRNAAPVKAGLKELVNYSKFGLTRGCMVRSPDKKIGKSTLAYQHLEKLTTQLGGEQAPLHPEEIQPLIEIYSIYQNCQSFGLTEEQVKEFSQGEIADNPLLQEILSDPSGKIDEYTLDSDELILLFDQFFEQEEQSDEDINDLLS